MKKNGFTIVEVLAVILIIAIVALISVPIIVNVLNSSRKTVFQTDSENIEKILINYATEHAKYGEYTFDDRVVKLENEVQDVVIDKEEYNGTVLIDNKGRTEVFIKSRDWCSRKALEENKYQVYDITSVHCK